MCSVALLPGKGIFSPAPGIPTTPTTRTSTGNISLPLQSSSRSRLEKGVGDYAQATNERSQALTLPGADRPPPGFSTHGSASSDRFGLLWFVISQYSNATKDTPPMPGKDGKLAANRRSFLKTTVVGGTAATLTPLYPALGAAREIVSAAPAPDIKPFELDEITISDLQGGMKSGRS